MTMMSRYFHRSNTDQYLKQIQSSNTSRVNVRFWCQFLRIKGQRILLRFHTAFNNQGVIRCTDRCQFVHQQPPQLIRLNAACFWERHDFWFFSNGKLFIMLFPCTYNPHYSNWKRSGLVPLPAYFLFQ